MSKALFIYSTCDGQTLKILRHMSEQLDNLECELVEIKDLAQTDFQEYDKVLIASSIRYGRINKSVYSLIKTKNDDLKKSNAAFICVNLTARKEDQGKDTPEGSSYIKTFLKKACQKEGSWKPELIGVFAGALRYPRYNFFDRNMIRFIMKLTGGETDTSKEIEYTNWSKVTAFAKIFAE